MGSVWPALEARFHGTQPTGCQDMWLGLFLPQGTRALNEGKQTAGLGNSVSACGQPMPLERQRAGQPGRIVNAAGK